MPIMLIQLSLLWFQPIHLSSWLYFLSGNCIRWRHQNNLNYLWTIYFSFIVDTKRKAYHLPFTFKFRTNRVNGDHYLVKLSDCLHHKNKMDMDIDAKEWMHYDSITSWTQMFYRCPNHIRSTLSTIIIPCILTQTSNCI